MGGAGNGWRALLLPSIPHTDSWPGWFAVPPSLGNRVGFSMQTEGRSSLNLTEIGEGFPFKLREQLPAILRYHRNQKGYTPAQLAKFAYCDPDSVENWEQGNTLPSLPNFWGLASVLGRPFLADVSSIFGIKIDSNKFVEEARKRFYEGLELLEGE